jgi:subtilisin-like proprotein convertase family protein
MNKLYSNLHTVFSNFKKPFSGIGLLLFLMLHIVANTNAQCNNTNPSGIVTAPSPGNTIQINACAFAGDYSTINGVAASTSYTVTSNNTPVTDYFTVRQGTPGGPVIAYGASPLTWTALTAGTYYVHVNWSYSCGTQATCRTTSITNNGSCSPPVITVTPSVSCGGTCVPVTASGADSYIWYPHSGLFHDCAATIPYQGGYAASLYTRPLTSTTYTVTGKINATGCTGTAIATVNFTPGAPRILPNPAYACVGGTPVKLRVTSFGTLQYCSGPVNIAVPDNSPAGISNTIAVAGTPSDCNTTGITVEINMAHTRIGDMVFALRAPNGQVINLDYFISGTGGSGASTGFTNTNITSSVINPLSSGSSPYTGIFSADMRTGATAGPTGMQPTSTNWGNLFSIINGNWTLGMYDGVSFQTGILNSWCIKFTYPCATTGNLNATPAVWTPIAGLYTDANASQAYVGTPIDSVWVKPTVAGSYTYQATTQGLPPGSPVCTSPPGSVTVIAGTPITITSQPANQNLCPASSTAVFSVSIAAGSGPVTYQWQLSFDGTTWYNIGGAAPYSGSNTATLTINPVTASLNGYLYRVLMNGGSGCSGATSNAALLRINPIPTVSITANPLVIGPTQTTTIFSTVTPNPATTYTWYYNNAVLPGAVSSSLLVNYGSPGDYQLKVTDANNCGVGVSNILTIANSFAANMMYTYPNPSGGIFQVRYRSEINTTWQRSLVVYNNKGEKIITRNFTQTIPYQKTDVDLRAHGRGLYWVEVKAANGERLGISRVVVQ